MVQNEENQPLSLNLHLKSDDNDVPTKNVTFSDNISIEEKSENGVKLIAGKKITAIFEVWINYYFIV